MKVVYNKIMNILYFGSFQKVGLDLGQTGCANSCTEIRSRVTSKAENGGAFPLNLTCGSCGQWLKVANRYALSLAQPFSATVLAGEASAGGRRKIAPASSWQRTTMS